MLGLRRSHVKHVVPSMRRTRHHRSSRIGIRVTHRLPSLAVTDTSHDGEQMSTTSSSFKSHRLAQALPNDAGSTTTNLTSVPVVAAGTLASATNANATAQQSHPAGAMSLTARIGIIGGASLLGVTFAAFLVWITYSLLKTRKEKNRLSQAVTPFQAYTITRPGMVISESYGPDATLERKMSYRSDDWKSYTAPLILPEPTSAPEWRNSKLMRQDSVIRQYQTSSPSSSIESLDDSVLDPNNSSRIGPTLKPLVLPQKVYGDLQNEVLVSDLIPIVNGSTLQPKASKSSLRSFSSWEGSQPFSVGSEVGDSNISVQAFARQRSITRMQTPIEQTLNPFYSSAESASTLSPSSSIVGRSRTPLRTMARGDSLSRSSPSVRSANMNRVLTASPEQMEDFPLPPTSQGIRKAQQQQPFRAQQQRHQQQRGGPMFTGTMSSQSPTAVYPGTQQAPVSNQPAAYPYQLPHQPPPLAQVRQQQQQQQQQQVRQQRLQEQQRRRQEMQQQQQQEQERRERQQWQQPQASTSRRQQPGVVVESTTATTTSNMSFTQAATSATATLVDPVARTVSDQQEPTANNTS